MNIVFQNEKFLIVRKEWGEHVHQPENHDYWVSENLVLVSLLRKQLSRQVYPVHRLDAPTKGLLIFALSSEDAGILNTTPIEKKYFALVRGWMPSQGQIEIDLESDRTNELVYARTDFVTLKNIELPFAVGKKFTSARYSLIDIDLKTGRYHQIRRHMNRISHPIIGDREHGDSHHNRFFREQMKIPHLCLWAYQLKFCYAETEYLFIDEKDHLWCKIFELPANIGSQHLMSQS